ncbi:MAG: LacI family transcriptional regulator [Puniceicoccaceae bacterium 5H]|nr:MAG: LacI family transcriptional regulator [Puniceicoccaceae bacterium 5H]
MPPHQIALVYDPQESECALRVLAGVARFLEQHEAHWRCALLPLPDGDECHPSLNGHALDGVITIEAAPGLLDACAWRGLPTVAVNAAESGLHQVIHVGPDNTYVGHMGAEFFVERGFRHLAYGGSPLAASSPEREAAFIEAAELSGASVGTLELPPADVADGGAPFALVRWLEKLPRPLGLLVHHDGLAVQVLAACQRLGLSVPEDLALLGINNESVRCQLCSPGISSIDLGYEYMGLTAARLLQQCLQGQVPDRRAFFLEPVEIVQRRSTDATAVSDDRVARAIRVIQDRATQGLTVDALARQLKISRSSLERRFRKQVGHSPQTELRQARLQQVKRLLQETDLTIAEIANRTGFVNPEYLYVAFKRLHRITPAEYRERCLLQSGRSYSAPRLAALHA